MAIEQFIKPILDVTKKSLEEASKKLGDGKTLKEAWETGVKTFKNEGITETQNLLESSRSEKVVEDAEELDKIQETVELQPETIKDPQGLSDRVSQLEKNFQETKEEIEQKKEVADESTVGGINKFLQGINEGLKTAVEIQQKLRLLGLSHSDSSSEVDDDLDESIDGDE